MYYTLNIVSKCRFFLYIYTFAGSEKVLENFSWGPGKSWKSPGFLSVKEWEPWRGNDWHLVLECMARWKVFPVKILETGRHYTVLPDNYTKGLDVAVSMPERCDLVGLCTMLQFRLFSWVLFSVSLACVAPCLEPCSIPHRSCYLFTTEMVSGVVTSGFYSIDRNCVHAVCVAFACFASLSVDICRRAKCLCCLWFLICKFFISLKTFSSLLFVSLGCPTLHSVITKRLEPTHFIRILFYLCL